MDNEPYRDLTHRQMSDQLVAWLQSRDNIVWTEFRLPTGRIADVLSLDSDGKATIYEIKTALRRSLLIEAELKYGAFCDYLNLVTCDTAGIGNVLAEPTLGWAQPDETVGIIYAACCLFAVERQPSRRRISDDRLMALHQAIHTRRTLG